jgi:hypothetical protein
MFENYNEIGDIHFFQFDKLKNLLPGEPEGKVNRALWMLKEDNFLQVYKADNIAYDSAITNKAISYLEKCELSADGKRITKYIEEKPKPYSASVTFNIANANNSIIGTQQNATINVTAAFEDVFELIREVGAKEDRESLENIACSAKKNKRFSIKDIPKWIAEKYPAIINGIATAVKAIGGIVEIASRMNQ